MIFVDQHGFLCNETQDGGDSAMRAGMIAQFYGGFFTPRIKYYEQNGVCVRHPIQVPWNNPKNFTRDQLIPLVAGLNVGGYQDAVKRIFWSHAKRAFLCQNSERDYPGSTKYPYPHTFINDRGQQEKRSFDFADPLLPDHIWHLIKCARLYYLYPFALVGIPWLILSIFVHARSSHKEHNQIISMVKVQGAWAVKLFKRWTPSWREDLREYWGSRNEMEYADLIIKDLEEVK